MSPEDEKGEENGEVKLAELGVRRQRKKWYLWGRNPWAAFFPCPFSLISVGSPPFSCILRSPGHFRTSGEELGVDGRQEFRIFL